MTSFMVCFVFGIADLGLFVCPDFWGCLWTKWGLFGSLNRDWFMAVLGLICALFCGLL